MGVIILETDNIYQPSVIEHIQLITDTLSEISGISSVSSLTNIINIKGSEYGIEIGKLVDEYELPTTAEAFEKLRTNILNNPMYKGSIVSEDETASLIVFNIEMGRDLLPEDLSIAISLICSFVRLFVRSILFFLP